MYFILMIQSWPFLQSHTVLHGRPAPLNGSLYANIFVHYEPLDHKQMNDMALMSKKTGKKIVAPPRISPITSNAGVQNVVSQEPQEDDEQREEEEGEGEGEWSEGDEVPEINYLSSVGQLKKVEEIVSKDIEAVHSTDQNGWQPLHEAIRGGYTDVVRYLIDMGADIGATTKNGGSPLWWARRELPPDHKIIRYLEDIGAPDIGDL